MAIVRHFLKKVFKAAKDSKTLHQTA